LADAALADPRPGPGRRDTRAAIEAAAVELFAKRGYHATSMRAIAGLAGVQAAAIYHWYPSKEALLVRLQDDFMERLTARIEEAVATPDVASRPALRLAAAVREHVVFHGEHTQEAFVTDSEIRALTSGPRSALIAKRDAYQDLFAGMVRAGIRDGTLRTSDARVATYAVLLQCTGVALWFDPDGPLPLDQVAELHVELVLGALGADPGLIGEAVEAVGGGR
jgi:AcrR family transcriptional regulator